MPVQSRQFIRRTHKILGLVVGVLFLFWTTSGLFFTLFPIEHIRGEHLVDTSLSAAPDFEEIELLSPTFVLGAADTVTLRRGHTGPVYEVTGDDVARVHDAVTGARLTPLDEESAALLAQLYWTGEGAIAQIDYVENPPREAGSASPLWRVKFGGAQPATLWIDPDRAKLRAVRTTHWRIFDVLWRFHILDITGADRIDSWWLRLAAFLGLTLVLFGFALLIDRAWHRRLFK